MNAFRFIGKLEFNDLASKVPYMRKGKTKGGDDYQTFNFAVVPSKNNRAFVECFGMVNKVIKTTNTENQQIEVDWDDRFDEQVVKSVARYKRWSVKLDGKYNEFITAYDFVDFCVGHLDELRDKMFVVTGSLNLNIYNGKISYRYQVQSIREMGEDEKAEPGLTVRFDTFFRNEDIVLDDWDKEKQVTVNAFTYQFIEKKDGKNVFKYVPTTFFIDLANEDNEKRAAFFLKQFGIEDNKVKIKKDEVASLPIRCNYVNGSEEVAFDESCLTENQKEAIELGLKTIDDFKPNGSVYGERVTKYVCIDADTRGDYANGYKIEQIKADEFAKEIFTFAATEVKADDNNDKADIEALFG